MVRSVYITLLILVASTNVYSQFYDFFSALQPIVQQTARPIHRLDVTTKRPRTKNNRNQNTHVETTTKRQSPFSFYSEESDRDKQKIKNTQLLFDFYSTTARPEIKTTKSSSNRRNYNTSSNNSNSRNSTRSNNKINKEKSNVNSNSRITNGNTQFNSNPKGTTNNTRSITSKPYSQALQSSNRDTFNNDRLIFDDGRRNTVINYETTRPNYHTTKSPFIYYDNNQGNKKNNYPNSQTTRNPLTIRPGVKPAVVNGPPITNRPATRRPSFGPRPSEEYDNSVSPELIIGPDEDYMSTVEKKRYIEMAERMCDKYKALDVKVIEAIPLVPSPDPVRYNVSRCTPISTPLIVGGRIATIQEFRHMALLGWSKLEYGGYSWKCGGSLVSNQFVLTAAHCAYQERDNSVVTGTPRAVQLGSSFLDDPGAIVMRVATVIRHPKYKLPKSYYDIAIVKMVDTVTFSNVIRPACLGIPPPPGKPIIATGWGRTEFGGDQSHELRSVSLPIWDMTECYNVLGTSRKIPEGPSSDSQVCAGDKKGGKDTCQGDSGGPAQVQDECTWRVVAVTSLGRSCGAPHTPALYARIPRAFVAAVVFDGKMSPNNNKQSNNNQQWNNQQSNNHQQSNKNQQWNNNLQQSNNQQQSNKNQQWNNNSQQQANKNQQQWNNQQSSSNQNWNNNQQQFNNNQRNKNRQTTEPSIVWNRNEYTYDRNTQSNSGNYDSNQSEYGYNVYPSNNNQNQYQQENRNDYYSQSSGHNYNEQYNNNKGQYNIYATARPDYNKQQGYYGDAVPSGYQSDQAQPYYGDSRAWWT